MNGSSKPDLQYLYCDSPSMPSVKLPESASAQRSQLVQRFSGKWVNGTQLKYYFFPKDHQYGGAKDLELDIVREAFKTWKEAGIGLDFKEVNRPAEAEIRIGFLRGDGAWSYMGRQILNAASDERTMNFGWDLSDGKGLDTALHEIGHTLGFPHEHQNPVAGIEWHVSKVYEELSKPPNSWTPSQIDRNVLDKLDISEVRGGGWDPNSIMHYPFPPGFIKSPEGYENGITPLGGLSEQDIKWVREFYPKEIPKASSIRVGKSHLLGIALGGQSEYIFEPEASRKYTFGTFGESDSVIALFEERQNEELSYIGGMDDSGSEDNAKIVARLTSGRKYRLKVRLVYARDKGEVAVMVW